MSSTSDGSIVLVTGATGFLGRALVARLASGLGREAGESSRNGALRCLVRDPDRAIRLGLPAEACVAGSLEDLASLRAAAAGVGAVVHLAGLTRAVDPAQLAEVNERAAGRLARAVAEVAPGARFVLVSSLAAAGPSTDGATSAAAPADCRPCSAYGRSKLGGEIRVLEHSARLDWCIVRPPIVHGPGDPATELLVRHALAPLVPVPWRPRPLSWIHVDDVADALCAVLAQRGVHGFVPLDGPERTDTDACPRLIAAAFGRRARTLRLPMVVPRGIATCADLLASWTGRASFVSADKMREASAPGWVADPLPAAERFGFRARIDPASAFAALARARARPAADARVQRV